MCKVLLYKLLSQNTVTKYCHKILSQNTVTKYCHKILSQNHKILSQTTVIQTPVTKYGYKGATADPPLTVDMVTALVTEMQLTVMRECSKQA